MLKKLDQNGVVVVTELICTVSVRVLAPFRPFLGDLWKVFSPLLTVDGELSTFKFIKTSENSFSSILGMKMFWISIRLLFCFQKMRKVNINQKAVVIVKYENIRASLKALAANNSTFLTETAAFEVLLYK